MPFPSFLLSMIGCGSLSGLMSGLFGVGGGIINVPLLDLIFEHAGLDPDRALHMAAGTSILTVVPASFTSVRAHLRRDAVDRAVVRQWGPALVAGAISGGAVGNLLPASILGGLFGCFVLAVAAFMSFAPAGLYLREELPQGLVAEPLGFLIGGLAGTLGIGGGALAMPLLVLCRVPIHRAIGTASAVSLLIALPAALVFMLMQWARGTLLIDAPLPGSFGNVNLLAVCALAPVTMIAAPLGAKLAHRLPAARLRRIFGVFLLLVAAKMIAASWR